MEPTYTMTNDTKLQIEALLRQRDLTATEIAAHLGMTRSCVNKALQDMCLDGLRLRISGQRQGPGKGRPASVYSLRRGKLMRVAPGTLTTRERQQRFRIHGPIKLRVPERHHLMAMFG